MTVDVRVQDTPNPNARRFLLDQPVQQEARGRFFTDPASADHPLAKALLALDGVTAVLLLPNSVTVTKAEAASWTEVEPSARAALEDFYATKPS